jgi:hypothetical protein
MWTCVNAEAVELLTPQTARFRRSWSGRISSISDGSILPVQRVNLADIGKKLINSFRLDINRAHLCPVKFKGKNPCLGLRLIKAMAIVINLNQEPVAKFDSRFGKWYIFDFTPKTQRDLHKQLGKSFNEADPVSFLKNLMKAVCYLEVDLVDGKFRPDGNSSIDKNDIDKLNREELEKFAATYIENNEDLFRETKSKTRKNERGNTEFYEELGEIKHPRKENESSIDYLHRLAIIEEKKQQEQSEMIAKSMGSITGFSGKLTESIKNSLRMGESIQKRMESIRPPIVESFRPIRPDIVDIITQQERARLRPFDDLSKKLDELIDSSAQVADFIVETNIIQTGIAQELKSSGDISLKFSKINIIISLFIIFLTFCSLLMTYSGLKNSNQNELSSRRNTEKYVNGIINEISGLGKAVLNEKAINEQNSTLMIGEFKSFSQSNLSKIESIIVKQNQMLEEIKLSNERNSRLIEKLEKHFEIISNQLEQRNMDKNRR